MLFGLVEIHLDVNEMSNFNYYYPVVRVSNRVNVSLNALNA